MSARRRRTCSSAASARRISGSEPKPGVGFYVDGVYFARSLGLLDEPDRRRSDRSAARPPGHACSARTRSAARSISFRSRPRPARERHASFDPRQSTIGSNCERSSTSRCPTGCSMRLALGLVSRDGYLRRLAPPTPLATAVEQANGTPLDLHREGDDRSQGGPACNCAG